MGTCRRTSVLAAGDEFACAVLPNGSIRCWGENTNNELGDGTKNVRPTPVDVLGIAGAVSVRPGRARSCATLSSGKVTCWGIGEKAAIAAGFTDVIDAVYTHELCAVRRSGEVVCGEHYEELPSNGGEESEQEKPELKPIPGLSGATAIVAGREHTCALLKSGEVGCWGEPEALGSGSDEKDEGDSDMPRPRMVKGLNDAVQISAMGYHTCAVRKTGGIVCWGANQAGQLGDGSSDTQLAPTPVQFVSDAVEVAAGVYHSCAVRRNGEVACWGEGDDGQLGNGERESSNGPVTVKGLSDAVHIIAGNEFSCASRKSGEVVCWGSSERGKLGNGAMSEHPLPFEVEGVTDATAVTAGSAHSCALRKDGSAICWGRGYYAGNGEGQRDRGIPPVAVKDLTGVEALRAQDRSTCAVKKGGEVVCFRGGVPPFTNANSEGNAEWAPVLVKGLGPAKSAVAYSYTGVALLRSGQTQLWNTNILGQTTSKPPKTVQTLPIAGVTDGIEIATGDNSACILRRSGQLSCFRFSNFNTFEKKNATKPGALIAITGIKDVVQVAAAANEFCALDKAGEVACFSAYELPDLVRPSDKPAKPAAPAKKEPPRATKVNKVNGISGATMVAMGTSFMCALLKSGEIACRGSNDDGQLGNGQQEYSSDPVRVKGISNAVHIAATSSHACAALKTGRVACWGNNESDQAGHKDPVRFMQPTAVKGLP